MTSDAITTVEGAGLVVTGLGETGLTSAGAAPSSGASLSLTSAEVGQIAAGGGVIANSGKNFGNDITLFAKAQKQQTGGIIQKDHMDISSIKGKVPDWQYEQMDLGVPLKKHKVLDRAKIEKSNHFGEPNSYVDLIANGEVKQRRYFDNDGNIIVDIEFSHGGKHLLPHKHVWINNERSKHNYE